MNTRLLSEESAADIFTKLTNVKTIEAGGAMIHEALHEDKNVVLIFLANGIGILIEQ